MSRYSVVCLDMAGTTVRDDNTAELADKMLPELEKALGAKVWAVIARFERKYLDANRPAELGYESDKAKPYYDAYHSALEEACKAVKKKFGRGILIDIHGQAAHPDAIGPPPTATSTTPSRLPTAGPPTRRT